jgi:hypothetical protein
VRRTLLEELGDSRDVEFFFRHAEHHLNDVIHARLHAYTVDFEKYHRRGPRGRREESYLRYFSAPRKSLRPAP